MTDIAAFRKFCNTIHQSTLESHHLAAPVLRSMECAPSFQPINKQYRPEPQKTVITHPCKAQLVLCRIP
eukprot:1158104-Pelagomonas_calceolata.AAC.6